MVKAGRAVRFFLVFKYPRAKSHDVLHPVSATAKATGCQQLQQGLAVPPTRAKPVPPPLGLPGELGQQRISPPFPQPRPVEQVQSRNPSVLVPRGVPPLTEAAARTALLRFVATRHCYGSRAAAELHIQELRPRVTYRYRLETFSESRLSEWAFEPFTKPGTSRPPGDIPPDLWDVEVGVPPLFQGQTRRCRVPRSALVRARCVTCRGSRRRLKQQKRCQLCSGTGRSRCSTCSGRGSKTCTTCQGEKKLRHFRQLVITWRNNVFEFVSEHHLNFPGELLSKVSGENIFQDENVVVSVSAGRRSLPGCCGDGWPAGSTGHPPGTWPRWVFCPTKEDRARPIYLKSPGELFIIGWQEPVEISAMYQELEPGTDCLSPRAVTQCQASVVNTLHLVLLSPSGSERCFSI
uniref:Ssu-2 homolog n=1 Tax=Anas zonorhyncha TaxID=75864 RepID=A0A8B9V9N2_9AVES